MFNFRIYILIFSFLHINTVLKAQAPLISEKSLGANTNYIVESWNSENGLPQNTVMRVFQSKDGFLWIATFNGLLRYDGVIMKLFNTLNTPGLPSNSIKNISEDKNGVLWFSTIDGKLIKYYKGSFETVSINDDPNISVEDICQNGKGELLVATKKNKIYNLVGDHFSLVLKFAIDTTFLTKIQYNLLDSSLNIGTKNGLYKYKDQQQSVIPNIKGKVSLIKKGANNDLWIYANYLLFYIENGVYCEYKLPPNIKEFGGITDFLIESKEKVWISTKKKGVVLLENGNVTFHDITIGLSSNYATNLYKDREGNIWVGTNDAGINKLQLKTFKTYSSGEGLLSNVVGAIIQKKDNSILIENFCQGITGFKDKKFSRFNKDDIGCVWSMMEDKESNLWIGTYGNWLYRLKNGKLEHFQVNNDPANNIVFGLFQDKSGIIWIGTDAGMYIFKNGEFSSFGNKAIIGSVRYITQDKKGRILFCSKKGLGIIEDGRVQMYTTKEGLSHNEVRFVHEDVEGVLWVATYGGGINRFKDEKFFAFNQSKNFMDDFTSTILEENEIFWVSTDHGVYSIKKSDLNKYADGETLFLNTMHFGKEDGLKNSECTGGFQSPGLKDKDGLLWFPTLAGVAIVDPKKNIKINYIPDLTIDSILVDENRLLSNDSVPEISRNIKKIEFQYSAPYFSESKNILFQYKLEGKDRDWSNPTKSRSASYLGLPPGNYVFKVRIYGSVNININKEKTIEFKIPFPFWRTAPFFIIIAIFLTGAFFIFNYLRIRSIRKKEEEKTEINKNYAALELKALQGQMNPHFIFNCLNSIALFIQTDNKSAASKYLVKFSKLIRLSLEYSTSSVMRLTDVINLLTLYVELEQLRLDDSFVFNLNIEPSLEIETITIPTMLLQPYVENAIHHGLWPKEKDGVLSLTFKTEYERLIIEIEDNGVGRDYTFKMKKDLIENRKSIGMSNTEERVKIINYLKNTNIKVNYIDKFNSDNKPTGTLVTISIPLI